MKQDTVDGLIGIVVILAILYISIQSIESILGFIFANKWFSIAVTVVASVGAAIYFSKDS